MAERSFWSRHGLTLIGALPVSLFIGLMLATAGVAVYPPMAFVAKPLICSGELTVESQNYSYRPGQSGVTRTFWCASGEAGGKPVRDEVTFRAVGASFLVYSAISFALLRFLVVPLLRRRLRDAWQARVGRGASLAGAPPGTRTDLQSILSQVADAVKSGEARVNVRSMGVTIPPDGPPDDDPAERLAQLKRLYEQGLITAADYEAKKAEILSGL
jgi:hypothetical protein